LLGYASWDIIPIKPLGGKKKFRIEPTKVLLPYWTPKPLMNPKLFNISQVKYSHQVIRGLTQEG
jgi:hypothetical protein